jgi:DNA-binding transcriptional MerR regulator/methylmalonyl-CoA mutase cobalamin-binding subunit
MPPNSEDQPSLSIGALSQATGIPKETIRTWERRYGYPDPPRNEAGHRAYSVETVARLRLVQEALDADHRPSDVVNTDVDTLHALLRTSRGDSSTQSSVSRQPTSEADESTDARWIQEWLEATANFDGDGLENNFYRDWNKFGGLRFLDERIGPFLQALGDWWSDGRLGVSHEHFVSEYLRDFLTRQWRPLSNRADGPCVVLANIPGEYHCMGLHMAAVVASLAGCEISLLGANTPIDEIVTAADQQQAAAVITSVSRAYDPQHARGLLTALANSMDREVRLVVGGSGRPDAEGEEIHLDQWGDLYRWATELVRTQV